MVYFFHHYVIFVVEKYLKPLQYSHHIGISIAHAKISEFKVKKHVQHFIYKQLRVCSIPAQAMRRTFPSKILKLPHPFYLAKMNDAEEFMTQLLTESETLKHSV